MHKKHYIDTHCHINIMAKDGFDSALTENQMAVAQQIVQRAADVGVSPIINVGTSVIESQNCIRLAQQFAPCFAAIGIHPNDCTDAWRSDITHLKKMLLHKKEHKIVAIGECGLDFHYPDYNIQRQKDVFKVQIELALAHDLALIVHTRDAAQETLRMLEEFAGQLRGTIHCFSQDLAFAHQVIDWGMVIGIGGTITYPKNDQLRSVVKAVDLHSIVLETDAPFLPPQTMRGQQNSPEYLPLIARFIANLRNTELETIAQTTSENAQTLFRIKI